MALTPEEIADIREIAVNATHYASWVWNEEQLTYLPPDGYPTDGVGSLWDEETLSWVPFE